MAPQLEALPPVVQALPPSAKQVFETLAQKGPLTHRDLVLATGMPGRTVRYAVGRLKDAGAIGARSNLMDCRQCFFYVDCKPAGPTAGEACPIAAPARRHDIPVRSWPRERL